MSKFFAVLLVLCLSVPYNYFDSLTKLSSKSVFILSFLNISTKLFSDY